MMPLVPKMTVARMNLIYESFIVSSYYTRVVSYILYCNKE